MRKSSLGESIIIGILFVTMVLWIHNQGYAEETRGVTGDLIKIGLLTDITGPASPTTLQLAEGVRNYFHNVNDKGGVNGRRIKLLIEDDRYSIPLAIAGFKKLVYRDKIFALLGIAQGSAASALSRSIEKEKLPYIASTLNESLISPVKRPIFIPTPLYEDALNIAIDYLVHVKKLKPDEIRVATVHPDNLSGKECRDAIRKRTALYGIKIVEEQVLSYGALDAVSQVLNIKKAGANCVFIVALAAVGVGTFLKDAGQFAFLPKHYITQPGTGDISVVRMVGGKSSKNLLLVRFLAPWDDDCPGIANLKKITLKYSPKTKEVIDYYIHGWVMSTILTEGLRRAVRDLTSDTLIEAIEGLKDLDTGGITGPITYSPQSHKPGEYARIDKVDPEKEVIVPLTGWIKPHPGR